jgi:hypothetical protein
MNKKKIVDKIYKCLRLAESCNPNEAAAAMRQARGLMSKYGISQELVEAAPVAESTAPASSRYTPPFWLVALSDIVACAFGCRVYLTRSFGRGSEFRFIGVGASAEIASYTFTVLHRRLREARRIFMDRFDPDDKANRTRQGDIFAQAWLYRVARYVSVFATDEEAGAAVDAYIDAHYGHIKEFDHAPEAPAATDMEAINMGLREGQRIKLYKPVREADNLGVLTAEPA